MSKKASKKGTVLYMDMKEIKYHMYYDYDLKKFIVDTPNKMCLDHMIQRIGKILEGCPLSDATSRVVRSKKGPDHKVTAPKCMYFENQK